MEITATHICVMAVVIILALGGSIYSALSVKTAEGFSLVGRAASAPLVAGSIVGVVIGGGASVGVAQMAYHWGASAYAFSLGAGIAFILQGIYYAKPLRESNFETISEFMGLHYGKITSVLVTVSAILSMILGGVANLIASIAMTGLLLDFDLRAIAAGLCVLIIATTAVSGQKGNSISGLVKVGVLWGSLLISLFVIVPFFLSMPDFSSQFPSEIWLNLFGAGGGEVLGNIFSTIVGVLSAQSYIQALFSASNARTASSGAFVSAAIVLPLGLPLIGIGMFMRAHHPELNSILTLPAFFLYYLPDWLGGFAVSGIFWQLSALPPVYVLG